MKKTEAGSIVPASVFLYFMKVAFIDSVFSERDLKFFTAVIAMPGFFRVKGIYQ